MQQRLQKILAMAGVASRRAAEQLISAGRVRVNGRIVTELGTQADTRADRVEVDGKRIVLEDPVYILLHKPRAVMSTMDDPEGRPTVGEIFESLPRRVYPVGRLDYQTSGALIMTNDGEFTARMLHPRHHVPKTYLIKAEGEMTGDDVERWRSGVLLDDGMTLPTEVVVTKREAGFTWFELVMREGRNQQIRRMGEATGFPVNRLTRLAFAGITIDGLRAGQWRFLTLQELRDLRDLYGVPKRLRSAVATHDKLVDHQSDDVKEAAKGARVSSEVRRITATGGEPKARRKHPSDGVEVEKKPPPRKPADVPKRAARYRDEGPRREGRYRDDDRYRDRGVGAQRERRPRTSYADRDGVGEPGRARARDDRGRWRSEYESDSGRRSNMRGRGYDDERGGGEPGRARARDDRERWRSEYESNGGRRSNVRDRSYDDERGGRGSQERGRWSEASRRQRDERPGASRGEERRGRGRSYDDERQAPRASRSASREKGSFGRWKDSRSAGARKPRNSGKPATKTKLGKRSGKSRG